MRRSRVSGAYFNGDFRTDGRYRLKEMSNVGSRPDSAGPQATPAQRLRLARFGRSLDSVRMGSGSGCPIRCAICLRNRHAHACSCARTHSVATRTRFGCHCAGRGDDQNLTRSSLSCSRRSDPIGDAVVAGLARSVEHNRHHQCRSSTARKSAGLAREIVRGTLAGFCSPKPRHRTGSRNVFPSAASVRPCSTQSLVVTTWPRRASPLNSKRLLALFSRDRRATDQSCLLAMRSHDSLSSSERRI